MSKVLRILKKQLRDIILHLHDSFAQEIIVAKVINEETRAYFDFVKYIHYHPFILIAERTGRTDRP